MKHLLVLLTTLVISTNVLADSTQHAEAALQLIDSAIEVLSQTFTGFEKALQLTREADRHISIQMKSEQDQSLIIPLREAKVHIIRATIAIRKKNASTAIEQLSGAISGIENYLDLKDGGGEELGLCCTRENCKGCTLGLVTKDVCEAAGIYKTFRKHKESNPYPNPPEAGQCEDI